ncbi:MAG: adenosylcobinamide-GDP ribazoletransferase [Candidatus Brocadiaceae bacterium]
MNNFLWALKFLTIIPFDRGDKIKPEKSGLLVIWFPVVGLCMGICLLFAYLPLYFIFPRLVAHGLILVAYIAITGAMHLDGLADTCDGIWGGWNKERRLEIMKDSRIGSFGAIGLTCLIGLKYLCLYSVGKLPSLNISTFSICTPGVSCFLSPGFVNTCSALLVMPVMGRWAQVCAAGLSTYARSLSGTGSFILESATLKHVLYATPLPLCLLWFFYSLRGFGMFAIIVMFTLIVIWYIKKKIGGMTGDTLGFTNEVAELVFLLGIFL